MRGRTPRRNRQGDRARMHRHNGGSTHRDGAGARAAHQPAAARQPPPSPASTWRRCCRPAARLDRRPHRRRAAAHAAAIARRPSRHATPDLRAWRRVHFIIHPSHRRWRVGRPAGLDGGNRLLLGMRVSGTPCVGGAAWPSRAYCAVAAAAVWLGVVTPAHGATCARSTPRRKREDQTVSDRPRNAIHLLPHPAERREVVESGRREDRQLDHTVHGRLQLLSRASACSSMCRSSAATTPGCWRPA
jgi:hypothetical protein